MPRKKQSNEPTLAAYAQAPVPDLTRADYFRELGSSGLTRFGGNVQEEFLREMKSLANRVKIFREMRENHPVVAAVLYAVEMSLRQVKFHVDRGDQQDNEAADFLESCLADMSFTWQDTLSQILTMLQYGFSLHELVYKVRRGRDAEIASNYDDGRIGWRKWLPLAQDTLSTGNEWVFDETGGVQAVNQSAAPDYKLRVIPIEKLLLFRTTVAKNNPEGQSVLRAAYISYHYSKNMQEIEGIGAERMGTGLPVVYMGTDTKKSGGNSDFELAKQIVRDTRTDEQMGIVIPYPKMGMGGEGKGMLFELVSPPSRGMVDFDTVINRYDKRIAMTVLAQFVMLGMESTGSFALSKEHGDLFNLTLSAWADTICETINRYAVPRLMALNSFGKLKEYPRLTHSEIAVPDLVALATYINTLVGAKVLVPDDTLESYLRDAAKLPKKDESAPTLSDLREKEEANAKAMQAQLQGGGKADDSEPQGKGESNIKPEATDGNAAAKAEGEKQNPKEDAEKASEKFGGDGSGNFGHAGRPGEIGGSAPGSGGDDNGKGKSDKKEYPKTPDGRKQKLADLHEGTVIKFADDYDEGYYAGKTYEVVGVSYRGKGSQARTDVRILEVGKPRYETVEGRGLAKGKTFEEDRSDYQTWYAYKNIDKIEIVNQASLKDNSHDTDFYLRDRFNVLLGQYVAALNTPAVPTPAATETTPNENA